MSSYGMMMEAANTPERGVYVEIRRQSHVIVGRVVWRHDRRFGIRTQDRLNMDAISTDMAFTNGPAKGAATQSERRSDPTRLSATQIAEREERSRYISAKLQFAILVIAGAGAALFAASIVWDALREPFQAIANIL